MKDDTTTKVLEKLLFLSLQRRISTMEINAHLLQQTVLSTVKSCSMTVAASQCAATKMDVLQVVCAV